MNITVVCTDSAHPVFTHLADWCTRLSPNHNASLTDSVTNLPGGDILFLISCSSIVGQDARARYRHSLVVHASDLPAGRGWSPLVWQILEGRSSIAVSLLEADDPVDSGNIWEKRWIHLEGHELYDEINAALFKAEIELMDFAIQNCDVIQPMPQDHSRATWYPRRRPEDSRLDPNRSLADQFDLIRTADPDRYPAFFDLRGHRFEISIRKKV